MNELGKIKVHYTNLKLPLLFKILSLDLLLGSGLFFLELLEDGVHIVESAINILFVFSAGKDDLATSEDQEDNFWTLHSIYKPWENLRFVGTEPIVLILQALQTNGETHVTGSHDVLDLKILHRHVKPDLSNSF